MTGLPRISGRDCTKALGKIGFYLKRQHSSHMILRRDEPFAQVVVPDHKELDRGDLALHNQTCGPWRHGFLAAAVIPHWCTNFALDQRIVVPHMPESRVVKPTSRSNRTNPLNGSGSDHLKITRFDTGAPGMPAVLRRCVGAEGEAPVALLGDPGTLDRKLIALFCSVRCPGDAILKTFDLARTLRDADVTVVGGFQSPMEREFLDLLLRGSARVVVCPARGIGRLRIQKDWKEPLEDGRLLILSFFEDRVRRPTASTAMERNERVAALVDTILIAHAEKEGKTEALCREALTDGKPVFALASDDNAHLIELGARSLPADNPVDLIG